MERLTCAVYNKVMRFVHVYTGLELKRITSDDQVRHHSTLVDGADSGVMETNDALTVSFSLQC